MDPKELLLLVACLGLLGELRLTSTTTTTTFVAAMSIANQDLERYFRTTNASQTLATMTEERIAMDMYTYAYLNYTYLDEQQQLVVKAFNDEKARYGEGKVLSVRGKLVHITDMIDGPEGRIEGGDFACTSNILGTRGEPIPAAGVSWIALVRRGRCTFEEKVMHVHAKGAAGVIIYNDKSSVNLEKMQIKGKSRNITAVITHQEIGQDMARIVDQGADMMAAIIEGRSGMRPIHSMNRTSVLFVSISFIVLMIISLVWLVFYYIQRFRYLQSKDQQSRHLCSVTKKAIMKIPTKTGKISDEKDADSDCCAICIETYKPSDCIRVLPCKHEFHKNCIDPWLIEHRTCPMCKLDVLKFYGYVVGDQITSSPNPVHHNPPNIRPHSPNNELDDVQVVAMPTTTQIHTQTQTQTQPESLANNSSSINSSSQNSSSRLNASVNSSSCSHNNNNNSNNSSNINSSSSCQNSSSNSSNGNPEAVIASARRNSAPQVVVTASRQVTDV